MRVASRSTSPLTIHGQLGESTCPHSSSLPVSCFRLHTSCPVSLPLAKVGDSRHCRASSHHLGQCGRAVYTHADFGECSSHSAPHPQPRPHFHPSHPAIPRPPSPLLQLPLLSPPSDAREGTPEAALGHVINVSALEGKFAVGKKSTRHPHTNMSKVRAALRAALRAAPPVLLSTSPSQPTNPLQAALNMLTFTCARDYFAKGVLVNAVDTGWVTDNAPGDWPEAETRSAYFTPWHCLSPALRPSLTPCSLRRARRQGSHTRDARRAASRRGRRRFEGPRSDLPPSQLRRGVEAARLLLEGL